MKSAGVQRTNDKVSFLRTKGTEKVVGLGYLAGSFFSLLALLLWHYYRYDALGSGLMLGWDTPDYVRMANEVPKAGFFNWMIARSYPQLYVQLLVTIGSLSGNVTLAERILPLAFALVSIYCVFVIAFRISGNIHAAGISALLQTSSIAFLKLFSDNNRNLMAFSLALATILVAQKMWSRGIIKSYLLLTALSTFVAMIQFETFVITSLTLIIASGITQRMRNVLAGLSASIVPVIILAFAFPGFFSAYFSAFQTPILTTRETLDISDFIYWTGGSTGTFLLSIVGTAYLFLRWIRGRSELGLLIFVWTVTLYSIFGAVATGLVGLSPAFGVRALLIVPSYMSVALGLLVVWTALSRLRPQWKLRAGSMRRIGVERIIMVILVLGIVIANSVFAVSQSPVYFNPYISSTAYNKIVQATSYFREERLGIPIVVFKGQSVWFADLYRSYVGSLLGEHFAYYGDLENLLQLRQTALSSSDPFVSRMQSSFSERYFGELTGTLSGPLWHSQASYVTDRTTLLSHPMLFIAPEFYDSSLPFQMGKFHLGQGIYVVPPEGLTSYPQRYPAGSVTIQRDATPATLLGEYNHLDPYDPYLAYVLVNASYGYSEYNVTSFPSDWKLVGIEQGGDPSLPEVHPHRPNGVVAFLGNDYADSLKGWSQVPANATTYADQLNKKEGNASLQVSGKVNSIGNLGLVLRLPAGVDFASYALISFWAKCIACSGMVVYLLDNLGNYAEFYDIRLTKQFVRFAIAVSRPTTESVGFNIHSVTSMSFLAYSPTSTSLTFWIDDIVVEGESVNPTYVYKGRASRSDLVEFQFSQRLAGTDPGMSKSPTRAYAPSTDIISLVATTFILPTALGLPMLLSSRPFIKTSERFRRVYRKGLRSCP